jgi:hypothetical protein
VSQPQGGAAAAADDSSARRGAPRFEDGGAETADKQAAAGPSAATNVLARFLSCRGQNCCKQAAHCAAASNLLCTKPDERPDPTDPPPPCHHQAPACFAAIVLAPPLLQATAGWSAPSNRPAPKGPSPHPVHCLLRYALPLPIIAAALSRGSGSLGQIALILHALNFASVYSTDFMISLAEARPQMQDCRVWQSQRQSVSLRDATQDRTHWNGIAACHPSAPPQPCSGEVAVNVSQRGLRAQARPGRRRH